MLSRNRLGFNTFSANTYSLRQTILNAEKTSEIVKSDLQLSKMTNLLKVINTENEFLNKQVLKLSRENKELKNKIANKQTGKQRQFEMKKILDKDFKYSSQRNNETSEIKHVIGADIFTRNNSVGQSNISRQSNSATFRPNQQYIESKFTQTTPPKYDTNRVLQKSFSYENPQLTSINKKQRPTSMHKLNPSSAQGLKSYSQKSESIASPSRPSIISKGSSVGSPKKRYLSLISNRK